jgi:hypothetical protein
MMPAAPLVGAVTTRPPAAFSSLTASAYRLTQSRTVSGSRIAASGRETSFGVQIAARGVTFRPPGSVPSSRMPRCHAGLHASQMQQPGADRHRPSLRQARSFSNITCGDAQPVRSQIAQQFVAAVKRIRQVGGVGLDAVFAASS